MFRANAKQKKRTSQLISFPAPIGGWINNRALAVPEGGNPGADVLENFFPQATSVILRRGTAEHADTGEAGAVLSLFSYTNGAQEQLFGATETKIFNVTNSASVAEVVTGKTGGQWSVIQFATAGGVFLVGVNGVDAGFLYDGTTWSATSITFPVGVPLTTADLCCVWNYKQRLYFIQKSSMDVWYLPVDQVGGQLTLLPLGGVFPRGGSLSFGETWSLDSGAAGGLSEQLFVVTTEGEVAVYQGLSPSDTASWTKAGIYRIGEPLGPRAWIRAGGDVVIATTIGLVPLSQAIQRDVAALAPASVSYPIETAWYEAVKLRGAAGWQCAMWPAGQMMLVVPPYGTDNDPVQFVANARTGAWCKFRPWKVNSLCGFSSRLFFGTEGGKVFEANVSGSDSGSVYTGKYVPLYVDAGAPASLKIASLARHTLRATSSLTPLVTCQFDWDSSLPVSPDATIPALAPVWDTAVWGESVWGAELDTITEQQWFSVGGTGYTMAPSIQLTSGSTRPIDAEIIRSDLMYQVAEVVT